MTVPLCYEVWVRHSRRSPGSFPSNGTTKLHRLEENIGAAHVKLSAADLDQINQAATKVTVAERYPEAFETMTGL